MNIEKILCASVGIGEDGGDKRQSVCPNVTIGGDVDVDNRRFSPDVEVDRILREELGSATVTSTPRRAIWPIHSKRRSSVSKEPDETVCKAVVFDVASGSGTVGGAKLSRGNVTDPTGGIPESFVTSGVFSTLEGIAGRQADERFVATRMGDEEEGMVRIPPADEMFAQEAAPKNRTSYYPSQSAKSLLKDCFEMNPPTHLDPSHPTTSFSVDQMIQFARAVGLEVSLASYSMLEDLLLKARGGSGAHPMMSRYPAGKSPFPSVAGSSFGDSVASRSAYSLPIITEIEEGDVIVGEVVAGEPCSSRQADARLGMEGESSGRPGTDSLKTLQQIKSSQQKKKSHSCKWSQGRSIESMEFDVPDLDFKRPFYYDVLEGKPFIFTTEESRVQILINLLPTFLESGGHFWALEDYWTQVGIATGHSAAVADFNWSPAHISVSVFLDFSKNPCSCCVFILWAICGHWE